MMVVGAVPVFFIPMIRKYCPESPRWLISKGRFAEAENIVDGIAGEASTVLAQPVASTGAQTSLKTDMAESGTSLLGRIYLRRTLTVWSIWFFTYAVAYGLQGWLPTLYRLSYGLSVQQALNATIGGTLIIFLANLLCAFTIDLVSRRVWFVVALGSATILLIVSSLMTAGNLFLLLLTIWPAMGAIATITTSLYLYTAEIYPTSLRPKAISVCSVWLRGAAIVDRWRWLGHLPRAGWAPCWGWRVFALVCLLSRALSGV